MALHLVVAGAEADLLFHLEAEAAAAADRLQAVVVDGLQTACTVLVQAPT